MFKVEKELRGQFGALTKTAQYAIGYQEQIKDFLANSQSICVCGCGSSYYVSKSIAAQISQRTGIPAYAVAAGDLLVNFPMYDKILENSNFILLSRSGSTTELCKMAQRYREQYPNGKILSISAADGAKASELADISLEIPWAFDHAVCQTQTVSNLFLCGLLLSVLYRDDKQLLKDIDSIEKTAEAFTKAVENPLSAIAQQPFEHVVVLADSSMAGIAEEGALAFKEICHKLSNFYNVLDVRHGPILNITDKTLVLVLVSGGDFGLQEELVKDIRKRTSLVTVMHCAADAANIDGVTNIQLPAASHEDISALFMIYCIQLICLKNALFMGINPDEPEGLDAWIELNI